MSRDRQTYADACTRVYTRRGRVAHLLPPLVSPNTYGLALCGTAPWRPESWRGTGSQKETETVSSLPLCRRCAKRAEAESAVESASRLARHGRPEHAS